MRLIELVIGEEDDLGIQAISLVDRPAIEKNFVALKEEVPVQFKTADTEKRLLLGPALIPDKPIYRRNGDEEYSVYFSKNTVRKAAEMFLRMNRANNHTLNHMHDITGVHLAESWIVESEIDKSKAYEMDVPRGTWMVAVKVENDEIWQDFVKTGKVRGFSIEGAFLDSASIPKDTNMKSVPMTQVLAEIEHAIKKSINS